MNFIVLITCSFNEISLNDLVMAEESAPPPWIAKIKSCGWTFCDALVHDLKIIEGILLPLFCQIPS